MNNYEHRTHTLLIQLFVNDTFPPGKENSQRSPRFLYFADVKFILICDTVHENDLIGSVIECLCLNIMKTPCFSKSLK